MTSIPSESDDSSMEDTTYASQAIEYSTNFYKTIQKQFEHQNKIIHELQKKVKKHDKIVLHIQPQQQQPQPNAMQQASTLYNTVHKEWLKENQKVEIACSNGSWVVATLDV